MKTLAPLLAVTLLVACQSTTSETVMVSQAMPAVNAVTEAESAAMGYSAPESWGLVAQGPFPTADDVCQRIARNEQTASFAAGDVQLIGCPVHERGAIFDREQEGARSVGQVGPWLILALPAVSMS